MRRPKSVPNRKRKAAAKRKASQLPQDKRSKSQATPAKRREAEDFDVYNHFRPQWDSTISRRPKR